MSDKLAGKRVLVIEDEYFIASDIQRALQSKDAIVVGPTGRLDQGLSLAAEGKLDAAVLDVNLEGTNSFSIADRLEEMAVPYTFLTGYDEWSLPERYRAVPHIAKPFTIPRILDVIEQLVTS